MNLATHLLFDSIFTFEFYTFAYFIFILSYFLCEKNGIFFSLKIPVSKSCEAYVATVKSFSFSPPVLLFQLTKFSAEKFVDDRREFPCTQQPSFLLLHSQIADIGINFASEQAHTEAYFDVKPSEPRHG